MEKRRIRAVVFTLAAAALWGTSFPVIKAALSEANPAVFLFFRFLIATSVLLALFFYLHLDRRLFIDRRLFLLGFLFSLSFFFQYIGQTGTSAGEAAVLLNTTPIIVPVLSYFALRERLGSWRYSAAAIGVVGVIFMSGILTPSQHGSTPAGVAEMLVSAAATSLYIIGTKSVASELRPLAFYPPVFLYGTVFMFLYSLLFGNGYTAIWSSSLSAGAIVYLSLGCSVIPFFLWYWGLRELSATGSSVVTLFEPVVAIVASVAFLGEFFGVMQLLGTALIFAAILVISR